MYLKLQFYTQVFENVSESGPRFSVRRVENYTLRYSWIMALFLNEVKGDLQYSPVTFLH